MDHSTCCVCCVTFAEYSLPHVSVYKCSGKGPLRGLWAGGTK